MKSSLFPLQQAIYTRLTGNTALVARVTGVHDSVPQSSAYPYVRLGDDTSIPWDSKSNAGEELTHTLHVFSQYNGKKEAKEILSLVLEALTNTPMTIGAGFTVEFTRMEYMEVFTDADVITQHGVMRVRFRISQT